MKPRACPSSPGGVFRRASPSGVRLLATGLAAFALAWPATHWARELPSDDRLASASVAELKNAYLACDRAAMAGQLTPAGIMRCSMVYETLKNRAFGGDFLKLREWSRATPTHPGAAPLADDTP